MKNWDIDNKNLDMNRALLGRQSRSKSLHVRGENNIVRNMECQARISTTGTGITQHFRLWQQYSSNSMTSVSINGRV